MRHVLVALSIAIAMTAFVAAQDAKPMSPTGTAATQVLGKWVKPAGRGAFTLGGENYEGGKWIEITYGRPLKRGRDLWGSGASYGKSSLVGAPIWRAGANVTTRLKSEVPLVINGKTVAPGEYTMFIELKEHNWTLVLSTLPVQLKYDPAEKTAVWGAYNYTPDKDVLRVPMTLDTLAHAVEQLTWEFVDMTSTSGAVAISWGNQMASVAFKVGT